MGWEARTVGGQHVLGRSERTGQVGERAGGRQCVNGEGGCMVWFSVQEQCGWGEGGGWAVWGHVGPHRCDTGMKHWEVCLCLASGGQALVV